MDLDGHFFAVQMRKGEQADTLRNTAVKAFGLIAGGWRDESDGWREGWMDGWGRESHLGSLERMTQHQEKDERMDGDNGGGV